MRLLFGLLLVSMCSCAKPQPPVKPAPPPDLETSYTGCLGGVVDGNDVLLCTQKAICEFARSEAKRAADVLKLQSISECKPAQVTVRLEDSPEPAE